MTKRVIGNFGGDRNFFMITAPAGTFAWYATAPLQGDAASDEAEKETSITPGRRKGVRIRRVERRGNSVGPTQRQKPANMISTVK